MIQLISFIISITLINSQELIFVVETFRHGASGSTHPYHDGYLQTDDLNPTGMRQ